MNKTEYSKKRLIEVMSRVDNTFSSKKMNENFGEEQMGGAPQQKVTYGSSEDALDTLIQNKGQFYDELYSTIERMVDSGIPYEHIEGMVSTITNRIGIDKTSHPTPVSEGNGQVAFDMQNQAFANGNNPYAAGNDGVFIKKFQSFYNSLTPEEKQEFTKLRLGPIQKQEPEMGGGADGIVDYDR